MTVVGPYTMNDWNTMHRLKESIVWYKNHDREKYQTALDMELERLKFYMNMSPDNDNTQEAVAA